MKIKQQMAALMTATALATISPALADGPAHMTPETMLTLARVGSGALSPDGKLVVYSLSLINKYQPTRRGLLSRMASYS